MARTGKLTEDRIPGTSPGFGSAAAADGIRYPYIFPIAATYWSQGAAAVDFVKKQLDGTLRNKKIAYIFYDNPAGREPIEIIEDLAVREGFQLKTFAVPPPGVEMGAQALDIAQRYRADFVIAHLFGRSPSVSIKELKRAGYPLSKVVSFVWGASEADIEAAAAHLVEHADFLDHPEWMVERKGVDQRSEAKPPRALRDSRQKNAWRWRHPERRRVVLGEVIGVKARSIDRLDDRKSLLVIIRQRQSAAIEVVKYSKFHRRLRYINTTGTQPAGRAANVKPRSPLR